MAIQMGVVLIGIAIGGAQNFLRSNGGWAQKVSGSLLTKGPFQSNHPLEKSATVSWIPCVDRSMSLAGISV